MNNSDKEKFKVIEDALLENVSGAAADASFCIEYCWEYCWSICYSN